MILNFKIIFILTILIFAQAWSQVITGMTSFENTLSKLNAYQAKIECRRAPEPLCPDIINKIVKDDYTDRALIIESRAKICSAGRDLKKSDYNNAVTIQNRYQQGRFNYLGDYSNSVVRSCVKLNNSSEVENIAKFYYYSARLNEGATKVAQERILIAKLLYKKSPDCPNLDMLYAANKKCEQAKQCDNKLNLQDLSASVEKDEILYFETIEQLKKLPTDCEKLPTCLQVRAGYSAVTLGLAQKNPWFLDTEFTKSNLKTVEKIKTYLIKADINLARLQEKINDTASCVHGSHSKKCELDEMRNTLSETPEVASVYTSDKIENSLTSYITEQACIEEGSLDRNRTGKIMTDTYWNIGLTVGTFGLGAVANMGRLAVASSYARVGGIVAESANLTFDIYSAATSIKAATDACKSDHLSFQFKQLDDKIICEKNGSALSAQNRDQAACLVSAGFGVVSALVVLPGGTRLAKLISAEVKNNPIAKKASETTLLQRKSDTITSLPERRLPSGTSKINLAAENEFVRVINLSTTPNLPKNIKIEELKKPDGATSLYYHFSEKLADGTWVKSTRELPIDEISGGINANFPAGRELFEKIVKEKAGLAHIAFIDVGSLGAVNKTFAGGSLAGDKYLKAVAETIIKNGEGKITLARLGGDEFGLIIDETDPNKVKIILEKIQADLRLNRMGEARQVFTDEKKIRAAKYKEAAELLAKTRPGGVLTAQDKEMLRIEIDELAKIQQPDISIGAAQIGRNDSLEELLKKSEIKAKEMKIKTTLNFGRSAEKYGSSEAPNAVVNPLYRAPIDLPALSPTFTPSSSGALTDSFSIDTLRPNLSLRQEEVKRFGSSTIARYEDETGRSTYRVERYTTDNAGKKIVTTVEIPTRGQSGILDANHSESQKLIMEQVQSVQATTLVMPKLASLKYLNYFENGSRAGDEMLEAVSEVLKQNMRTSDLTFKLGGADFLWSLENVAKTDVVKISEKLNAELLKNPKVIQILASEKSAINLKLAEAIKKNNSTEVAQFKEKLKNVENFKPDLKLESVSNQEAKAAGSFKKVIDLFEQKFQGK